MKIKSIKKLSNKYKIVLENNDVIITYDEVILKNNILYKKEIDINLLKKILEENKYYEAYNKVLKYIKTKLRSEFEITKYIEKLDISKEEVDKIINDLKKSKLIDDLVFVKAYIHDRISLSSDGPYKIKKELLSHKISDVLIDNELEKVDELELKHKLEKLILKKLKTNSKYSSNMLKQKLLNYFINLGYEKKHIMEILENNKTTDSDILKKEYMKLYNKYKNKYDEFELKRVLKQKLYQKGFNYEDINNIVN